jgi:hypothetical protein
MGLIRGALHIATYGAVSPKSKKQRMASMQLATMQGKSEAEIKIAGSRNFDWVNQSNIRMKQQRELRARRRAGFAEGPTVWDVPSDDPVNYYPVTIPSSGQLHLIYGDMPDAPTLCGRSGAQKVPEALSIDNVTCAVCRAVAGDFSGPPRSPKVTGRCGKCSRPVVWYGEGSSVHTATGKVECPVDADSEEGTPVAAEPSNQEGTGVAAELERLAALHSLGALDDEEFRAAKARIIHGL